MKRQTQSSHTFKKNTSGLGFKSQHQGMNFGGNGFEIQSKIEKIPTTFVFDKNIHPNDYKNYISIDDIYNENFEYARKLFEDPSRAFVVADYSNEHKVPRRLAQVNYNNDNKKLLKDKIQMNKTATGGSKQFDKINNTIYPPPPKTAAHKFFSTSNQNLHKPPSRMTHINIQNQPQNFNKQNDDQLFLSKDVSFFMQQSQHPDYVNENIQTSQKNDLLLSDFNQQSKNLVSSAVQFHDANIQDGQMVSHKDVGLNIQQNVVKNESKVILNKQGSFLQKKNSFSGNPQANNQQKTTAALPALNSVQVNNFTTSSMNQLPKEKKVQEDRVHGLIASTREKVKKLQSYAEKLKRRVMQNDYGQNHKRNQKTIKKSQLVKNFIFNDDDFNKMLIQEEEEDKKTMANKKEKTKGFKERLDASTLDEDTKKDANSYQSQFIEQNINKRGLTKQTTSYKVQEEDEESDKSKDDLSQPSQDNHMKSDIKNKHSKHNFHKKMKLKKRNLHETEIVKEAEQAHEKVLAKIDKFQKHWNNLGIMHEKVNTLRAQSLQYARSGKILRNIGDKYGDLDLFQPNQTQKLQINNQQDLLNHLQALLTKPDATGDFKLHKQVVIHKNRIKNMRHNDVGIENISNLSIEI